MTNSTQTTADIFREAKGEDYKLAQDIADSDASYRSVCDSCGVSRGGNHTKHCSYLIAACDLLHIGRKNK